MKLISAVFSILVVTATQSVQSAQAPQDAKNTPDCKPPQAIQDARMPDCGVVCRIFVCEEKASPTTYLAAIKQEI